MNDASCARGDNRDGPGGHRTGFSSDRGPTRVASESRVKLNVHQEAQGYWPVYMVCEAIGVNEHVQEWHSV